MAFPNPNLCMMLGDVVPLASGVAVWNVLLDEEKNTRVQRIHHTRLEMLVVVGVCMHEKGQALDSALGIIRVREWGGRKNLALESPLFREDIDRAAFVFSKKMHEEQDVLGMDRLSEGLQETLYDVVQRISGGTPSVCIVLKVLEEFADFG